MICGSARKPEGESVNEKDPKCRQKCDLRRTPEGVSDSGSFYRSTLLIRYLGMEYLGLNSLFTSILQILNLAELE